MTIVLEIVVVAAIVFGAVAYAVGHLEGMRPAPPDSGEIGLPPGPVSAGAIERTRFGLAFRGYRMAEVDAVLDRLRDELAYRDEQLADRRPHPGRGVRPTGAAPAEVGDEPTGESGPAADLRKRA